MTSPFTTTERLDILTREVESVGPHHFAKADVAAALDEIEKLRADRNRFRAAWNNARSRAQSHAADLAYTAELGGQAIKAEAQAVRDLEAENARLRAALERQDGEARFWHFEYQAAMDNWRDESGHAKQLRAELADTALMRDFNQRSADHIAAKRDLAEAAIEAWDRDDISGDAAVLMIRKALANGPVPSADPRRAEQAIMAIAAHLAAGDFGNAERVLNSYAADSQVSDRVRPA